MTKTFQALNRQTQLRLGTNGGRTDGLEAFAERVERLSTGVLLEIVWQRIGDVKATADLGSEVRPQIAELIS